MTNENKFIAEFMGMKQGVIINEIGYYDESELQYHTSFDWLMPVVEKIETLGYIFMIAKTEAGVTCGRSSGLSRPGINCKSETKLQSTYDAVVQFITHYNSIQAEIDRLQAKITELAGILLDYETKFDLIAENEAKRMIEFGEAVKATATMKFL